MSEHNSPLDLKVRAAVQHAADFARQQIFPLNEETQHGNR